MEPDSRPLLRSAKSSWREVQCTSVFLLLVFAFFLASRNEIGAVRQNSVQAPVGAGRNPGVRIGSEETKVWLTAYYQRLKTDVKETSNANIIPPHKSIAYSDILQRTKQWIPWADQPNFMFFYLYEDTADNIQAGVGTVLFHSQKLMELVHTQGRREFEAAINSQYCDSTSQTRPHWKYMDDIFSHDVLYMVGIHKYPTCATPNLMEELVPFIIDTVSKKVATDMWEFWVPWPLNIMHAKLESLGFQETPNAYNRRDGSGSWADLWFYEPSDFVAAFNYFVLKKCPLNARLIYLSRDWSYAFLGHQVLQGDPGPSETQLTL